ncbi:MAG: NAD/NADP octopine/nopaline dehydrogenase family protein [Peptococcaceae bacterium]|jgi:opine dehydrogenase|nr:NAD/NADP octopine/nopaline dehydrogenase family protein [Peptococcaceae bacterium]
MINKLTFVGGGATGHTAAALFTLRGYEATLYDDEFYRERFEAIERQGGILLRGKSRGLARIHRATTSPREAIPGAEAIFINVAAERHEAVARRIAPYLRDGQQIIICPGNLGSFIFRRVFREMGMTRDVTVSELEGNLFPCRLTGEAEVKLGLPLGGKGIASLPAGDTGRVIEALEGVLELKANKNVFECAVNSTNFVMHLGATLLSAALIEGRGELFNMFKEGLSEPAVNCARAMEEERRRIMRAMGLIPHMDPISFMESLRRPAENPQLADFISLDGPDSLTHRYITEDVPCCAVFCASLGRRLGCPAPLLEAFITVAGVANGADYWREGRGLENLGFGPEMDYAQIEAAL